MKLDMAQGIFSLMQAACDRSAVEFELTYQTRVAIDHIRFAIKVTEDSSAAREQLHEARLQLLEPLDRLASADRNLPDCFRARIDNGSGPRISAAGS